METLRPSLGRVEGLTVGGAVIVGRMPPARGCVRDNNCLQDAAGYRHPCEGWRRLAKAPPMTDRRAPLHCAVCCARVRTMTRMNAEKAAVTPVRHKRGDGTWCNGWLTPALTTDDLVAALAKAPQ